MDYKEKKVLTIGAVSELTLLSVRQIRYYEERNLITPKRTDGGTRRYSFNDVEALVNISNRLDDGCSTFEIKKEFKNPKTMSKQQMLAGQYNAYFNRNQ